MQKLFNKVFNSKFLFYAAPFIYIISYIVYDVFNEVSERDFMGYYYIVRDIMYFVIMLGIILSFKKHEKNVMKGLVGALLFDYVSCAVTSGAYYGIVERSDVVYSIFAIANGVLAALLFLNHFRLAADHKAKPITVYLNQILIILLMLLEIAWEAYYAVYEERHVVYAISYCISEIMVLYLICAVETKIDFFKSVRQEKIEAEASAE